MSESKIKIYGAIVLCAITIASIWWLLSDTWVSLYPVDNPNFDKNAVVVTLEEAKIDYKFDEQSKHILVKRNDLTNAHNAIESQPVSQKVGAGLEMFSNSDYGLSEFVQNVNYQRAMEEELARSIRRIQGIKDARVHLSLKKQSFFDEKKEESKASVILTLKENITPDKTIARGVKDLVAASITSLKSESIVILDDTGKVLSADSDDLVQTDATFLEKKYTNTLTNLLSLYLGEVKFNIAIDIKLDKKKKIMVADTYLADPKSGRGFITKSRYVDKKSESDQANNAPNQNSREEEFAYSKEHSEVIFPVGAIDKVSIAIVVKKALSIPEKNEVKDLIVSAVNLDLVRGDSVSVISVSDNLIGTEVKALQNKSTSSTIDAHGDSKMIPILLGALSLVLFCLTIFLYALYRRATAVNSVNVSPAERDRLLNELKEWLKK